jgi:organic radical activating enzyme
MAPRNDRYFVNNVFYSIQGEGSNTGRPAAFVRFAGCPLRCSFCDEPSAVGPKPVGKWMSGQEIYQAVLQETGLKHRLSELVTKPLIVFTGGEPLLQLDKELLRLFSGWPVAIETNGTVDPYGVAEMLLHSPLGHVCVSPKGPDLSSLVVTRAHELKLVYPQDWITSAVLDEIEAQSWRWGRLYLQPRDNSFLEGNIGIDSVSICSTLTLRRPRWRLSLQTHKLIGLR